MILHHRDFKDDGNQYTVKSAPMPINHCDWCGEPVAGFDRFCPATDCQAAYFEACREDGDPIEHKEINEEYRRRGWA